MEAPGSGGPRAGKAPLDVPQLVDAARIHFWLRPCFPLLGLGSGAGHVHNGLIVYAHVGGADRSQIYAMTATGTHRHPLTTGRRYSSYDPAFSPNGKRSPSSEPTSRPTSGR